MVKIHYSSYSSNPFFLSITYTSEQKKLKQLSVDDKKIKDYLKTFNISIQDVIKKLETDESFYNEILAFFAPADFEKIKEEVLNIDEDIDINKIDNTLKETLKNLAKQNLSKETLLAWVKFAKKISQNVDPYIRSQLYPWLSYLLQEGSFSITLDGDIIGYKGVQSNNYSVYKGQAYVDGKKMIGNILNNVGSIISMDRNKVEANKDVYCSQGLHVGSYNYARGFGEKILLVSFSPEDVVSIPIDYNYQKLRCCKYKVIKEVTTPFTSNIFIPTTVS